VRIAFEEFSLAIGLEVSRDKSEIFLLGSVRDGDTLIQTLAYKQGTFPITYLGLPYHLGYYIVAILTNLYIP